MFSDATDALENCEPANQWTQVETGRPKAHIAELQEQLARVVEAAGEKNIKLARLGKNIADLERTLSLIQGKWQHADFTPEQGAFWYDRCQRLESERDQIKAENEELRKGIAGRDKLLAEIGRTFPHVLAGCATGLTAKLEGK